MWSNLRAATLWALLYSSSNYKEKGRRIKLIRYFNKSSAMSPRKVSLQLRPHLRPLNFRHNKFKTIFQKTTSKIRPPIHLEGLDRAEEYHFSMAKTSKHSCLKSPRISRLILVSARPRTRRSPLLTATIRAKITPATSEETLL